MPLTREDALIDWLRRRAPGSELLGDDAAFLDELGSIAVSVDQQIAGTHFPEGLDPAWIARRLVEVCLSDLAACAARPRYAFLTVAAPARWDHRRFFTALTGACRGHGMNLAGGDIARSRRPHLTLCVLGDRPRGGRLVRRSTAVAGDRLWVGGALGGSAVGRSLAANGGGPEGRSIRLPPGYDSPASISRAARRALRAHLAPRAQLELGRWLGRRRRTAAIDISDGFALDLARLCRASGVGAMVDLAAIPIHPAATALADRLGIDALDAALGGGEDYVLLFALPRTVRPPAGAGAVEVGRVTSELGLQVAGSGQQLEASGWSHL